MIVRATLFILIAFGLSGCASSAVRAPVALVIPDPPPHPDIAPVQIAEKPEPEQPPTPAEDASDGRGGRPAAPARPRPPAPSSPAAQAPPAAAPPAATVPAPGTELRPAGQTGAQAFSAQQVREIMNRTSQKLNALDRGRLSTGKRDDYDAARRFLLQADTAVKNNDLLLAQSSAEKAEMLADGLR